MNKIVWFRYDLRISENSAFAQAIKDGNILPLFIFDEGLFKLETSSSFHLRFIKDSLNDLKDNYDFKILTKIFFNLGMRRILVESGLIFLKVLLKQKLINDLFIFQSNGKLSKNGFKKFNINNYLNFKPLDQIKVNLDEDKLFKIKVKYCLMA